MPISISLGQNDKAMDKKNHLDLRPGEWYLVCSDKPMTLPDGVQRMSTEGMGARMRHDGMRKDKREHCGGFIKMDLQDNGYIKYQCVLCEKEWIRDAEGKLVKNSKEK